MSNLWPQWRNAQSNLLRYWRGYGGISSLVRSPYLGLSLIAGGICWAFAPGDLDWFEAALAILPSMLGFSIAGFAILLVFSSDRFLRIIAEGGRDDSLYMKAGVTFVHFIFVQCLAIFLSIFGKVFPVFELIGVVALFYSVATAIAACFVLFDIAQVYNRAASIYEEKDDEFDPKAPTEDLAPSSNRGRKVG